MSPGRSVAYVASSLDSEVRVPGCARKCQEHEDLRLWVPSLAQPNPTFQYSLDWLLLFDAGEPAVGWSTWLRQLILPMCLTGFTAWPLIMSQQKGEEVSGVSYFSVLLTAWISLELPQAISVYYLATYGVKALEDAYVKQVGSGPG